jgi:hypothetical protein
MNKLNRLFFCFGLFDATIAVAGRFRRRSLSFG